MAGVAGTVATTLSPLDDRTRTAGNARPSSSAVRASPTTGARRPRCPHAAHAQAGWSVPHQRQISGRVGRGQRQRARADAAAGGLAAALARQRRGVAQPRGLDEDRSELDRLLDQPVHLGGDPGAARVRVAAGVGPDDADPGPVAQERPGRADLVGPARAHEVVRLGRAREAAHERGRALLLGAQQERLAGVGVRRPRLGVQVVTVVPADDQAEVADRGERRRAGADHDADRTPGDAQEASVALGRALVGGERDVGALAQHEVEGGGDPVDVAAVGHAHQGAPPAGARPPRRRARPGAASRCPAPRDQTARGAAALRPGARGTRRRARGRPRRPGPRSGRSAGGAAGGERLGLRRGMPGRDGEPEHVGPDCRRTARRARR